MEKVNIGKIIKQGRIDKNIPQKDLAKELNVTSAALSAWENNRRNPPVQTFILLAKKLDIVGELFGETDKKKKDEIEEIWKAISRIEKILVNAKID